MSNQSNYQVLFEILFFLCHTKLQAFLLLKILLFLSKYLHLEGYKQLLAQEFNIYLYIKPSNLFRLQLFF